MPIPVSAARHFQNLLEAITNLPAECHSGTRVSLVATYLSPKLSTEGQPIFPTHEEIRVVYFKSGQWDSAVATRAKNLLLAIAKTYAKRRSAPGTTTSTTNTVTVPQANVETSSESVFAMAMALGGKAEVELYIGDISPVAPGYDDALGWWKKMEETLPILAAAARDVLAIPGPLRRAQAEQREQHLQQGDGRQHAARVAASELDAARGRAEVRARADACGRRGRVRAGECGDEPAADGGERLLAVLGCGPGAFEPEEGTGLRAKTLAPPGINTRVIAAGRQAFGTIPKTGAAACMIGTHQFLTPNRVSEVHPGASRHARALQRTGRSRVVFQSRFPAMIVQHKGGPGSRAVDAVPTI
ncbi:hypothetical protein MIND_01271500 [Mycena indigotica]|uniref:Uncharacterized protein n=1 Tax=Mycena indigotica TaxID=2126181 RepID=A0A8H6S2K2_9AGAR|nr:uncharacterized protein MIND_01271500 [Mycena indigotica]KAF7291277.1 hypothetical protein MIND_01271500 [Mycena indigotica]